MQYFPSLLRVSGVAWLLGSAWVSLGRLTDIWFAGEPAQTTQAGWLAWLVFTAIALLPGIVILGAGEYLHRRLRTMIH